MNASSSSTQPPVALSVIAPMYNEQGLIAESVAALRRAADAFAAHTGKTIELILVNDGSTDDTLQAAQTAAADDPRITVLSYRVNRGRGYALRTGIAQCRGDYVITTESDLSWGETIIDALYRALIDTGADIVIASPYRPGGALENVPFKRRVLSRLGNWLLRRTVSQNISMLSGMTRGYRGTAIRSLPLNEDRKEIHLEIVSKAAMLNWRFAEIPAVLRWAPPVPGTPKRKSKFHAGALIRSHLLFGCLQAPALLLGGLGLILTLAGTIMGIVLAVRHFFGGATIGDRPILILTTAFLILAGLILCVSGFVALMIRSLRKDMFQLHCRDAVTAEE